MDADHDRHVDHRDVAPDGVLLSDPRLLGAVPDLEAVLIDRSPLDRGRIAPERVDHDPDPLALGCLDSKEHRCTVVPARVEEPTTRLVYRVGEELDDVPLA
ncbi:hypothetical protein [Nocardioides sp. LMS-CY]|uniref:hypothetical protein n=1 Tax=Nocardioides sp. (strain LMS-CY) TaxID=2840457 RepID=UPI0020792C77|nr:hypothetical protein [Nocardioides sp. LMS-CY]